MPANNLMKLDFPSPLRPIRAILSPFIIVALTSSKIIFSENRKEILSKVISGIR